MKIDPHTLDVCAGRSPSMFCGSFDNAPTYTTATNFDGTQVTLESVLDASKRLRAIAGDSLPTESKLKAAKEAGFGGYPGIKCGTEAIKALRANTVLDNGFPPLSGISVVVDPKMPPDEIQTIGLESPGTKWDRLIGVSGF